MHELNKAAKLADSKALWRRDLAHCGPNPMNGTMDVRLFFEPSTDRTSSGILRFRPQGFSSGNFAEERDPHNIGLTQARYLEMWQSILNAGFTVEGEDPRFSSPCPMNAVVVLDDPRSTSEDTLATVVAVADQWKTYLNNRELWHRRQGETPKDYTAIYLSSCGSSDWLGEVGIWPFQSCCPEKDQDGLRATARWRIGEETDDHFSVVFILPTDMMQKLALRLHGIAINTPLDLRPVCIQCNKGKQEVDKQCMDCFVRNHEAEHALDVLSPRSDQPF